jgi:hypothetical protein
VLASFERVFPGALLVDINRQAFLLVGAREPLEIDLARFTSRIAEPGLAALLAGHGIHDGADLLAHIEGPTRIFAALAPEAANTDDNAFVETRTPRQLAWTDLDADRGAAGARRAGAAAARAQDVGAIARALLGSAAKPWPSVEARAPAARRRRLLRWSASCSARRRAARPGARADAERACASSPRRTPRARPWRALDAGSRRARRVAEGVGRLREGLRAKRRAAGRVRRGARCTRRSARRARLVRAHSAAARAQFPRLAYTRESAPSAGCGVCAYDEALEPSSRRTQAAATPAPRARGAIAFERRPRARTPTRTSTRAGGRAALPLIDRAAAARADRPTTRARSARQRWCRATSVAWLRADLAAERGSPAELEQALAALRQAAPSRSEAVGAENAFRSEHGLPLRGPLEPAERAAQ